MSEKEFFRKFIEIYKDFLGDNLISVVLFGSHARGDAKNTSDYDLFIIAVKLPSKTVPEIALYSHSFKRSI